MIGIWIGTAVVALAAVLGVVWGRRALDARRLNAAAEAYAKREVARTRHAGLPRKAGDVHGKRERTRGVAGPV